MEKNKGSIQDVLRSATESLKKFSTFIKLTGENTEELIYLTTSIKEILNDSANKISENVAKFRVGIDPGKLFMLKYSCPGWDSCC